MLLFLLNEVWLSILKSYYGSKRKGLSAIDAIENYNKKLLLEILAYVYDSFCEIKETKRKYFKRNTNK
jgi:hypothetical protein